MTEPLRTSLKDILEICYLGVFEKTITLMVSKRSLTQFTVIKIQFLRLILDYLYSFFKSELAQLDICSHTKLFMISLERNLSLFCSVLVIIKKTYFT